MSHRCENCDVLRERIAILERIIGAKEDVPVQFKLSEREGTVLGILMRRERANEATIHQVLYGNRPDDIDSSPISVFIYRIRQKLKPFDISIDRSGHGSGWHLSVETKMKIFALLEEEQKAGKNKGAG